MTEAVLTRVICCPGAAELLDALAPGGRSYAELRHTFPRRVLDPAVRVLAAEGAVRRSEPGTWDGKSGRGVVLSLTATGQRLVAELSDLDVWVAVYERYLNG
ncbi:hypothetical protein ACGFMK_20940 [Amycolatopsis sp. NPDC049252]|uniref:hypothetical protein n=1 Tax=Amycolatopsis sp. NPDC049252 TaxID=3363933 RepID=UPI00371FECFB